MSDDGMGIPFPEDLRDVEALTPDGWEEATAETHPFAIGYVGRGGKTGWTPIVVYRRCKCRSRGCQKCRRRQISDRCLERWSCANGREVNLKKM